MNPLRSSSEATGELRPGKAAFTLVEMMVVMAIIVIVLGIAVPPLVSSLSGSQLTQASQQVVRQLDSARQAALSQNRTVEVRFYKYTDTSSPASYRAFQAVLLKEDGTYLPLDAVQKLPGSIMLNTSTQLTSFIGPTKGTNVVENPQSNTTLLPPNLPATFTYFAFQFRPNGSTTLVDYKSVDPNNQKLWYFTLSSQNATGTPPANYATVLIDPNNGDIRMYRP